MHPLGYLFTTCVHVSVAVPPERGHHAPAGSGRGGGEGRTAHRVLRLRRRVLHHRHKHAHRRRTLRGTRPATLKSSTCSDNPRMNSLEYQLEQIIFTSEIMSTSLNIFMNYLMNYLIENGLSYVGYTFSK